MFAPFWTLNRPSSTYAKISIQFKFRSLLAILGRESDILTLR
jgi:hypothetical protein